MTVVGGMQGTWQETRPGRGDRYCFPDAKASMQEVKPSAWRNFLEEWDCSHYCYSGPSVVLANALSSELLPKESHHQGGLRLAQLVHLPAHRTLTWTPGFPRPSCPKLLLPVCLCVHCPDPSLGLTLQLGHRRMTPSWPISDVIT